ncbi:MAG: ribulose-phosphate 3-epimerase [Armatimonadetes bacterium]|nr:ribulose-phosphate 3-epimerase [Armatimonadota bacterium]
MIKIAPSILSADFLRLGEEVKAAEEAGADVIHVDVMDGRFVPNITIGPPVVAAVKKATSLPLDVHLMIVEPEKYIEEFARAGADYLVVHQEASLHLHRTVQHIKELGVKAGVSINPSTPVYTLEDIIEDLDLVLIMSVNPGFGGQAFIPRALDKLRIVSELIKARNMKNPPEIEIDGGIKPENARQAVDAGATMLVMGSAFYGSGDYKALVKKVRESLGE